MARKIESIKVLRNKYGTTVYVNFEGGRFGTHSKENGKWTDNGLSAEELAEAKGAALVNGKWTDWSAPKTPKTPKPAEYDRETITGPDGSVSMPSWKARYLELAARYGDEIAAATMRDEAAE